MPAGDCPACPWAKLLTPPYRVQGWDIPTATCGPDITWLPSTAACKLLALPNVTNLSNAPY